MQTYLITPHSPLVLRTGKPFGETGGGDSFAFPLPSTVAGALRTACADSRGLDFAQSHKTILGWASRGALPAEIGADGKIAPLFSKPMDAHYTRPQDTLVVSCMRPMEMDNDEGCDLPDKELLPVLLDSDDKSKPVSGPAWWSLEAMIGWLSGQTPDPTTLGADSPPIDVRTHVSIEPGTLAAKTGQLFQSAGPDFEARRLSGGNEIDGRGWQDRRYGILARFAESLAPSLVRLGGEGRLSGLTPAPGLWPELPAELENAFDGTKRLRLILCTPTLFSAGWRPGWIGPDLTGECPAVPGLKLKLRAAALDRWLPISGWDILNHKPKAVRRMVPAGSVYWFDIINEAPDGWVRKLWLNPISDDARDYGVGFGLVMPGLWT